MAIDNVEYFQAQEIEHSVIQGSIPNFTIEELSLGTSHAIIGEVKQITPVIVELENRKYVFSDVLISVERDLFNEYSDKEITVRIQGGELDNIVTESHMDVSFSKNERVLIFIAGPEPESIWKDSYYVAGLQNGKYSLSDEKAIQSHSFNTLDESSLISQIQSIRGDK